MRRKHLWSAMMHRLAGLFAAFMILCGLSYSPVLAQDTSLTVFAAASMKNALDDIDASYTAKTGIKIVASYAASSALAKQIEQGAPADIFVSADTDWMDYATRKKTIQESTRVNLLGNSIVLIAPKDSTIDHVAIGPGFDLAKLADGKQRRNNDSYPGADEGRTDRNSARTDEGQQRHLYSSHAECAQRLVFVRFQEDLTGDELPHDRKHSQPDEGGEYP